MWYTNYPAVFNHRGFDANGNIFRNDSLETRIITTLATMQTFNWLTHLNQVEFYYED
jgi:hypothetical protein